MNISGLPLNSYPRDMQNPQDVAGPSSAASSAALSPSHPPILFRSNIDDQSLAALDAALQQRHALAHWANQALQTPGQLKMASDNAEVARAQDEPVRYSWVIPSHEGHKDVLHLQMQQISDQPGRYELLALGRSMNGVAIDSLPIKRRQPDPSSNDRPGTDENATLQNGRSYRGRIAIVEEHQVLMDSVNKRLKEKSGRETKNPTKPTYNLNSSRASQHGSLIRRFLQYLEGKEMRWSGIWPEMNNPPPGDFLKQVYAAAKAEVADNGLPLALNMAFGLELLSLSAEKKRPKLDVHEKIMGEIRKCKDITPQLISDIGYLFSQLEENNTSWPVLNHKSRKGANRQVFDDPVLVTRNIEAVVKTKGKTAGVKRAIIACWSVLKNYVSDAAPRLTQANPSSESLPTFNPCTLGFQGAACPSSADPQGEMLPSHPGEPSRSDIDGGHFPLHQPGLRYQDWKEDPSVQLSKKYEPQIRLKSAEHRDLMDRINKYFKEITDSKNTGNDAPPRNNKERNRGNMYTSSIRNFLAYLESYNEEWLQLWPDMDEPPPIKFIDLVYSASKTKNASGQEASWASVLIPALNAGFGLELVKSKGILKANLKLTDLTQTNLKQANLTQTNLSSESIDKLYSCALDPSLLGKTKIAMVLVNSLSKESNPLAWVGREGGIDQYEVSNPKGQVIFIRATQNRSSQYDINQIGLRYANGTERSWSLD